MNIVNSTYHAAATLLPKALPVSFVSAVSKQEEMALVPISLSPWTLFDQMWTKIVGHPAGTFRFVPGQTPMSTFPQSASAIAVYYVVIFGGRELMRDRPAYKLNTAFIIHNFYLTLISGGLLALFIQQIVPTLWRKGLFDNICGASGWTQPLEILYYLNYLTKYLELLDTVFLVLKKKPLTFLHTYHHGATAMLCYFQLVGKTPVSWVPITLNLTVHVVMYWYYFQAARGVRVWWKKYITMLQISQFILDLGFVYFATYTYYANMYIPSLPHMGYCGAKKQEFAAFAGCSILSSYLVLFIMFYFSTYKKPAPRKELRKSSPGEMLTVSKASEKATKVIASAAHAVVETMKDDKCPGQAVQM